MYISEVPCGDASMGVLEEEIHNKRENKALSKEACIADGHWSGAKTIDGGMSLKSGIARIKSGRSDMTED